VRPKPSLPPGAVTDRRKRDLVSSLALWFAARRKGGAAEGQRSRTVETKAALRLVCLELLKARTAARDYVEKNHRARGDVQLTTEAWQAHRSVIAFELSLSDWTAVVSAFDAVNNILIGTCDVPSIGETTTPILTEISTELIIPLVQEIERGCIALAPYALDILGSTT
jgi:hypothetical protein